MLEVGPHFLFFNCRACLPLKCHLYILDRSPLLGIWFANNFSLFLSSFYDPPMACGVPGPGIKTYSAAVATPDHLPARPSGNSFYEF